MKTATSAPSILIQGDGFNLPVPLPTFINGATPFDIFDVALTTGNNTITIPAIPTGTTLKRLVAVISSSTTTYTLKGVAGDTGFNLGAGWQYADLPTGLAVAGTFVLNVSANDTIRFYMI